jgi:DNA mismatch repair protein MutL
MAECRIRVLEPEVASQIAAGEVVERPASVVKELLENSIDAGSTRISVEVFDGGKAAIHISDNGCGMTAQEAVLAFQRHATSKISRAEDLTSVRTLGFRGEALPSVASVARITLVTRPRDALEGCRLETDAGEIHQLEPAGAAEGTEIWIRDLFYNTPARLKFLRSNRAELGQICDVVTRAALSYPGISFRLLADETEVLHAPGSADPLNTIATLYGREVARELVTLGYSRPGLSVEGYVSRPSLTRPTRAAQHQFVNGRWVRNRTITHALDEAFRSTLPPGRHPFALLHLEIDPAMVDVNVHPAKSEVRFLRDWEVHRAVTEAVRQALAPGGEPESSLARRTELSLETLGQQSWLVAPPHRGAETALPETEDRAVDAREPAARAQHGASGQGERDSEPGPPAALGVSGPQPSLPDLQTDDVAPRVVAQLWASYLLVEGAGELRIIDQHLAHERVLFDQLLTHAANREQATGAIRTLEAPIPIHVAGLEARLLGGWRRELARVGFELEEFGRDTFLLRSFPVSVSESHCAPFLMAILADVREALGQVSDPQRVVDRLAAATACRSAVKKGVHLGAAEMERLVRDLERCSNRHTCPHGCPIAVQLSYQDLLRRFRRI